MIAMLSLLGMHQIPLQLTIEAFPPLDKDELGVMQVLPITCSNGVVLGVVQYYNLETGLIARNDFYLMNSEHEDALQITAVTMEDGKIEVWNLTPAGIKHYDSAEEAAEEYPNPCDVGILHLNPSERDI